MSPADNALYAATNWLASHPRRLTVAIIVCATSPAWLGWVVGS